MNKYVLVTILFFATFPVFGQLNTDSIFDSAIKNGRSGNYEKAISEAKSILKIHPSRYDVMIFIANVYGWKGAYNKALNYIEKASGLNQTYKGLYDSWLNILLWSKKYNELIETSELALQNNYPDKYNIILKKALAYKFIGDYKSGICFIDSNRNYLDSSKIKDVYNEMQMLIKNNAVSTYYSVDFFENNTIQPQHLSYIDYAVNIQGNTLIPRFNYTNRFNKNDFQLEADYYHLFKNGHYLYSNYGRGINQVFFPKYRVGIEYYLPLLKTFEFSVGSRFLYADNNSVTIVTGHISNYYKNFRFSVRPFYVIHDAKNLLTTVLDSRYYSNNPINYWRLELLYGYSPDDRYELSQSIDNLSLKNYRVKLEKNIAVSKYGEMKLSAAYIYEEYNINTFRQKILLETLLKYKF